MRDFPKVPPGLKKSFLIGLAAGTALTFAVIIAVIVIGPSKKEPAQPELPALAEAGNLAGLSVYDFAVPDGREEFLAPEPFYFREPGKAWTREEVGRFWIDPREIGIDYLSRRNREKREEVFRGVP